MYCQCKTTKRRETGLLSKCLPQPELGQASVKAQYSIHVSHVVDEDHHVLFSHQQDTGSARTQAGPQTQGYSVASGRLPHLCHNTHLFLNNFSHQTVRMSL